MNTTYFVPGIVKCVDVTFFIVVEINELQESDISNNRNVAQQHLKRISGLVMKQSKLTNLLINADQLRQIVSCGTLKDFLDVQIVVNGTSTRNNVTQQLRTLIESFPSSVRDQYLISIA